MIITSDIATALQTIQQNTQYDMAVLLTDSNTATFANDPPLATKPLITIEAGDENKNLEQLQQIWDKLTELQASRQSLLICLGGGMTTDIGGMAAATYKRGMHYVNIPTTILAAVDASVGGKTAINYNGLKNHIGVFAQPDEVIICPKYYATLNRKMRLSGIAEMIKHALLESKELLTETLALDPETIDTEKLSQLIGINISIKERITTEDPTEKGIRKALNLGHTLGHAFEAQALIKQKPIPHGYAVMWGLVGELYLSVIRHGFDKRIVSTLSAYARNNYPRIEMTCKDYDTLLKLMRQDKKNHHGKTIFTLLQAVGKPITDCVATDDEICEALDYITGVI